MTSANTLLPESALIKLSEFISKKEKVNAILVVKSKKSGIDFTYKVKSSESVVYGYSVFISYETSYMEFQSCGVAKNGIAKLFQKFQGTTSPTILGAKFILDKIVKGNIKNIIDVSEIHHTGNCIKCNRVLTDLNSIELGIGPHCANS